MVSIVQMRRPRFSSVTASKDRAGLELIGRDPVFGLLPLPQAPQWERRGEGAELSPSHMHAPHGLRQNHLITYLSPPPGGAPGAKMGAW